MNTRFQLYQILAEKYPDIYDFIHDEVDLNNLDVNKYKQIIERLSNIPNDIQINYGNVL